MYRHSVLWAVFALLAAPLWNGPTFAAQSEARSKIEQVLAEEGLVGVAWMLVHAPGDVTVNAAGLRDNRRRLPFETGTRLHVGSVTKTLLATGVLRLASERLLDLDAPAHRYLAEQFLASLPPGFKGVTVRHLLDHTSGLDDARLWQMFSERASPDAPLTAAFPDPATQLRIRARPGAQFSYSNIGYTLLGVIIESVAGQRYEDYLDKNLLEPLGMGQSTFHFTAQEGPRADAQLAWGHIDDGSPYAAAPVFLRPAAQFTTTAADLAKLAVFLLGDGRVDGQPLIDPSLLRARGKPQGTEAARAGLLAGYSLGLGRRDRNGVVGYCHSGNTVGFFARLCIFPEEGKALAYGINTDSETANYDRLDAILIDTLEIPPAAPPQAIAMEDLAAWTGWYVPSPNRFAMFEYLDTVLGAVRLQAVGEALHMRSLQREARHLQPAGERQFTANDRATASHVVYQDDRGRRYISDGFQTYGQVQAAYLVLHWVSLAMGLLGIVWLLLAGSIGLLRRRGSFFRRAEAPACVAGLMLLLPIPFFLRQSFMALGDFTFASATLAAVTGLLPAGALTTLVLVSRRQKRRAFDWLHATAALLVLQWTLVLAVNGLVPLRLWG